MRRLKSSPAPPRQIDRLQRHRQSRRQVDCGDASDRGDDALPAPRHDARLRSRNQHRRRRSPPIWPCATPPTIVDGWSKPASNGQAWRAARNESSLCRHQQRSRAAGMVLWRQRQCRNRRWTRRRCRARSSWRCLCFRNVIAGRSEHCSHSTTPLAEGPTRCICRRASEFPRCTRWGTTSSPMPPSREVWNSRRNYTIRSTSFASSASCTVFIDGQADFDRMLAVAQRSEAIAKEMADPIGTSAAHSMLGVSYHLIGNQAEARTHLEVALARAPAPISAQARRLDFHYERPRIVMARTLWFLGYPDQAANSRVRPSTAWRRLSR